jgi:hypothetical protein
MRTGPPISLLGVAAALVGCGGQSQHDQVAAYVRAVNRVQTDAGPALQRATRMYARFAKGRLADARAIAELASAQDVIVRARARVAALQPPAVARSLAARILRVYDLTGQIAQETTQLAAYLPRARVVTAALQRRTLALRKRLGATADPAGQNAALRHYARAVDGLRQRLSGLLAPPILAATQHSQLSRLRDSARLARRLGEAAAARDGAAVTRLLGRFGRATAGTAAGSRLTHQEIRSYSARLNLLERAIADVNRDEEALQRQVR